MNASQVIEELQRLPAPEVERVYAYLFSNDAELDRVLATFDRLPRASRMTEEEILDLPRAGTARQ